VTESIVRRYRNRSEYEQDLERQAAAGWIVASVAEQYPRLGCTSVLLAPFRWRNLPPKPQIVVTYELPRPQARPPDDEITGAT
jgi:hypothetical protein